MVRFARISSGLRRTRSASVPSAGPISDGSHMANTASAARLSDPVRDLTQIPAVSHIADVPNPVMTTAARYSPALRSRSTLPAADPATAPPEP